MAERRKINTWWLFQIVFLIAAFIIVEIYNKKGDGSKNVSHKVITQSSKQSNSNSSEIPKLFINQACVCLDIDRDAGKPLVCKRIFNKNIDELYCFSEFENISKSFTISHHWYYGENLMENVKLELTQESTKGWSSLEMNQNWAGKWHVDILDSEKNLLKSLEFELY